MCFCFSFRLTSNVSANYRNILLVVQSVERQLNQSKTNESIIDVKNQMATLDIQFEIEKGRLKPAIRRQLRDRFLRLATNRSEAIDAIALALANSAYRLAQGWWSLSIEDAHSIPYYLVSRCWHTFAAAEEKLDTGQTRSSAWQYETNHTWTDKGRELDWQWEGHLSMVTRWNTADNSGNQKGIKMWTGYHRMRLDQRVYVSLSPSSIVRICRVAKQVMPSLIIFHVKRV